MDRAILAAQSDEVIPTHRRTKTPASLVPEDGVYQPTQSITPVIDTTRSGNQITPSANENHLTLLVDPGLPVKSDGSKMGVVYQGQTRLQQIPPVAATDYASGWIVLVLICGSIILIQLKYPLEK